MKKESLKIKKDNLRELREIIKNSQGTEEVLVITNKGDDEIVANELGKIKKQIFRSDGKVRINAHAEETRRGQWLGLLDAYRSLKAQKDGERSKGVMLGGMYPGKGTRLSPRKIPPEKIEAEINDKIRKPLIKQLALKNDQR